MAYGDEEALAVRAAEYAEAGADEVAFAPFPVGGDWGASLTRTIDALAAVSRAQASGSMPA